MEIKQNVVGYSYYITLKITIMSNVNFVEEGLLPLEKLMDEEVVSIMGGVNPNDFNIGCNCECSCDVDDFCEAGMPNN